MVISTEVRRMDLKRMARAMITLTEALGYEGLVAQGGDTGADICM